jgi:hypothetical protein
VHDRQGLLASTQAHANEVVGRGEVDLPTVGLLAYLGMEFDPLFDLVARMPVEKLREPSALLSPIDGLMHLFLRVNARLRSHLRFVDLCKRLGLAEYWRDTGCWPDCVEEVAQTYDFLAEAKKN